jgi:hypothetical protein
MLRHVFWETFTDVSEVPAAFSIGKKIVLIMEAVSTSETSVHFYQNTWCNIPEDSHLHTRCRENLKSQVFIFDVKRVLR